MFAALTTVTNPATVVTWLGKSRSARLLGIHQFDLCLTDEAMPLDLRVGGALVLLFGMLVSRITQLTKDDVIEDNRATWRWPLSFLPRSWLA